MHHCHFTSANTLSLPVVSLLAIVFGGDFADVRCLAQESIPPATATVERPASQTDVAEERFRQLLSERLPELARVATGRLPHVAQGNPPRINFFKVGKCVVTRSQHGGLASGSLPGGLVGVCLIDGDMNVPASNSVFAVTIGAWRLSDQPWPLRNSKATVESIVVIDAEEP
jgi:hypothetical protein